MAGAVVALRPLALEQGLRLAVLELLLQVAAHAVAAVVAYDRAGAAPDAPALLLQAPADVHVVAGDPELGIKAADRQQARLPERHVATGDVLGDLVGEQHVDRPAGRVRHALRHLAVAGWRDVRAADAGM